MDLQHTVQISTPFPPSANKHSPSRLRDDLPPLEPGAAGVAVLLHWLPSLGPHAARAALLITATAARGELPTLG